MKRLAYLGMSMSLANTALAGEKVVFVHGIFEKGYSFIPMKKKMEAKGCDCLIPSLKPADARSGIETLAAQLKKEIDTEWGDQENIHIVAHSMGGLVSRYYLQELGGHTRCNSLTTMGTPHHGTLAAHFYPGKGAWQMRPGSEFLQQLEKSEDRLKGIPLHSFRTPFDLIILPSKSSHWKIAENHIVYAPAHPLVMHTPRVQRKIIETVQTYSGQSAK